MGLQKISAADREALNRAAKQAMEDRERFGRVLPGTVRMGRIAASRIQRVTK